MGFFDNIIDSFGESIENLRTPFRVMILGDSGVYLEGILAIKSYSPSKIEVSLKKGGITIKGEDLFVKKYCVGDLVVCGKINTLERT